MYKRQAFNTQVIAKEATPAKATQQVTKADDKVDQYLAINVGKREMVVDEKGQALSAFKHKITNIGKKPIQNIQWVGAVSYTHLDVYKRQLPWIVAFLLSVNYMV